MHHAQVLYGSLDSVRSYIQDDVLLPGPDTGVYRYERLGIDDVRELKQHTSQRPVTKSYRSFVLVFQSATTEAQNALLKLLEEPVSTTQFHIIVPREDILLPTVRSRLMSIRTTHAETVSGAFLEFYGSTYAERLLAVAEHAKAKDINWMRDIVNGAELWAEEKKVREVIACLVLIRTYNNYSGSSKKMLLEELALTLPVSK
jgi:DNA polymerase III delta prime subunit